ncbi:MAG: galactose-1-phosphate uridylyltransferase [Candidatus Omnitrophota bacterium]|nr:galactose-1-phosphate uridylyltransferase [Candidatus Omnitrophota bacterium]
MPELRKDPVVSRWVIIATERARRPAAFVDPVEHTTPADTCPFCKGEQAEQVYAYDGVRVVKSGTPFFNSAASFAPRVHGLYEVCPSYGAHEVVIETPQHIANMADLPVEQIKNVFATYALRMRHHQQDAAVKYVLAYKNYGLAAGSRDIGHTRSQIMAVPVLPIRVKDKIIGAKRYFDFHERCLFEDLVQQERRERERVVLETDNFIAFTPFAARFPFETWIVPKRHHWDFAQGVAGLEGELAMVMKILLLKFKTGLHDPAYNFVIHSAPFEGGKPDSVKYPTICEDYRWHIELMPRLTRVAGFERGTGFYICPIPPEMAAKFLREVQA